MKLLIARIVNLLSAPGSSDLSAAMARSSIAFAWSGVPNSWAAIEPTLTKDVKTANAKINNRSAHGVLTG